MNNLLKNNYWENYWNNPKNVKNKKYQVNVGRTKNGQPIDQETWNRTLEYIINILDINKNKVVLELCCGNGEIIGNISGICEKAIGVDYSKELIQQLKLKYGKNVIALQRDVLKVKFDYGMVDIIIIYFAIQHFTEKETIQIIGRYLPFLKKNGIMFIGDVPDESKKWEYINKEEYRIDYIKRVIDNRPKIGYWYQREFFHALGDYYNLNVKILEQPTYQINSSYRFDVILKRKL